MRAEDCLACAGDGESDVGVAAREEFEESWPVPRGRVGDEASDDP